MAAYVDKAYLKGGGYIVLPEEIDQVDARYPGAIDTISSAVSRLFDGYLIKRYAAPFSTPYPEALRDNVARVVAQRVWYLHGGSPTNTDKTSRIDAAADAAMAWLKEAANSQVGLVELPSRESLPGASGVSAGGPLGYTETSPYVWTTKQAQTGSSEDSGTG